ncbi:MAG: PAS domain S-box protein [Mucilaginibacter sp.]
MLKSIKIPIAFLLTGIAWAFLSDPVIILLLGHSDTYKQDLVRELNDVTFVIIITIILYIEIKRQQRKLSQSEEEYRQLFESNPNPMWIYDIETFKFIKVNDAAIATYGYTRKQFLSKTIFDIRSEHDREKVKKEIKKNKYGINYSGTWEHIKANGEFFKVSIISHYVTFNNKKSKMVMATDLTELLDKEQKLNDALEKLKKHNITLLDIAWSNSHELRKPLCSIISLVDLLQESTNSEEKAEYLSLLNQCAAELDEMSRKNNEKLDKLGLS